GVGLSAVLLPTVSRAASITHAPRGIKCLYSLWIPERKKIRYISNNKAKVNSPCLLEKQN
ncbi:MAG TPA: hypothetical protein PLU58_12020, partial [Saprospiraceae bacterium]|nr:hypothetical protein [Saprospiraceae bacterium]